MTVVNLSPAVVAKMLSAGQAVLIDVREKDEFAVQRIAGARSFPLSHFDPADLPEADGKKMVFVCAGGMRSARAAAACKKAGLHNLANLQGGLSAWKNAGLPTEG